MSGRKFTELNAGTVGANSIFAQAQAPATPGDPYTSTKVSATDVGNFVNGTQAYADIGNVTPLAAIAALQQGGASTANIADEYDSSHTYNTGDRVIYEGVLYVCNDDNVTGAWDSTKWDSATIDEIISALTAADIPYSAGMSVADKLATIPIVNVIDINENFTSSTTMAYTGVSFDVPAKKSAIITVSAVYATNKPNMVTVNSSSTNVNAQIIGGTYINKGAQASGILVNNTNATKTYYVWAEYASAGANMIEVHGITI